MGSVETPPGGSAQLIFNKIKSVEYTVCNKTVVIPCFVSNIEAKSISELYVKWKLKGENIFIFDGNQNQSSPSKNFTTASISSSDLLMGIASLKMDKHDAVVGNYTCEVTELSREGETIVELKYRIVSWFSPNENILTVVFPVLAILLFWGQFGIVTIEMSSFTIAILILQGLGYVLSVVGLSLCVSGLLYLTKTNRSGDADSNGNRHCLAATLLTFLSPLPHRYTPKKPVKMVPVGERDFTGQSVAVSPVGARLSGFRLVCRLAALGSGLSPISPHGVGVEEQEITSTEDQSRSAGLRSLLGGRPSAIAQSRGSGTGDPPPE
ncbi:hypothetical protein CB1_001134005 [Camelus ferus]|nr:hypothetical protein CB1_001134005 [Camelus ferus]